jgi:primosomal protein N' (replication factor Y)
VVEQGRQAIVLVPEIALTPQTVRRFIDRFKRVAVLHSGLSATDRHRFWQRIAMGHADVVVGARSAIFAPVPNLGVIVVDEEHESSYKQDSAPRYHARDVAVKRAQLQNVPVILGSATPSLETYERVRHSKIENYHYVPLPNRVMGLALPHVELVDMKVVNRMRRGVHLLSPRLEYLLKNAIDQGQQAILLLNRRGYSNFVYCPSCQHLMQCKYCDTTMTYHRSAGVHAEGASLKEGLHKGQLHCHYCLAVNALPDKCPQCGKLLSLFGLGTHRV